MKFYLILMVICLGLVGRMDFEDAVNHDKVYCESVKEGLWPDYKGIYDEVCKPNRDTDLAQEEAIGSHTEAAD